MGISCSCPFSDYSDLENQFESVIVKSISFGKDHVKTPVRSISFNGRDCEPTIVKSLGSGQTIVEGSISFKRRESRTVISIEAPLSNEQKDVAFAMENAKEMVRESQKLNSSMWASQELSPDDPSSPKHEAAVKLQKVYKSFRTRRKLADCAVLVEQSWWKLLDFAELKRSSISFFDLEKNETAISRWSRARTKAAKVGKGLLKNNRGQKLALQHWLEAIDPRHRYGHNLHLYYVNWLDCQSREPFFYWLDIGEGKEVNLVDKCPRSKLQQQCIKYLGPNERKAYEVMVEDGKFLYRQTKDLLHTIGETTDAKWIFVLSTSKTLYVGKKKKGEFQHSSFLAGGATSAAGRLVVENGSLKAVWPHSGHYRPTQENFNEFISFLKETDVDITDVKMSPVDDEESFTSRQTSSVHIRNHSSGQDIIQSVQVSTTDKIDVQDLTQDLMEEETVATAKSRQFGNFWKKPTDDEISEDGKLSGRLGNGNLPCGSCRDTFLQRSKVEGQEVKEEVHASAPGCVIPEPMLRAEEAEGLAVSVQVERVVQRPSRNKPKSLQLGKQLSCKWTTGAGPRIGCVRNYPPELQFRVLEEVNLSPRSMDPSRSLFSPRTASGLSSVTSQATPTMEQL
ncbi:IQ domain-containing protein IQM2-like [Rhodamnia argentea]|uniref:IQ domain-containing protein IQM2-like n=1 Tax=Rhodamnia argentea TaxID=178133 RepID=A0A8B8NPV5_9MYRT|nr:IQ domain-containing protein IQM2-like [Rhodamnia argentea]